jgi:cobalt-zinc-cadmium efflux system outer membrane protein
MIFQKGKHAIICLLMVLFASTAFGQNGQFQKDSILLTIDSAEHAFLQNNFLLLAQKYNIDAQRALVIQAKLYPNPNININRGFYNPVVKKFFAGGTDGETAAGLSQLVILAGKRNKQIKIAETNTKLAEYQFYDLIRTLKYTLRTDFFTIYYLQQSANVYDEEIKSLQQVVNAFQQQQGKGYIAEKEVVRIKAQLYSLESEYNDLINQINDTQSELRLVLQLKNVYIKPALDEISLTAVNPAKYPLATLVDSAYSARTDLKLARTNVDLSRQLYSLQKAIAVPDITLQAGYDEQGSYIHSFNSVGFGIDIPIFNRNQGNIKSAKSGIDISVASQKSVEATVEEQVARALLKALDHDKLYKKIDPSFGKDFERLMHEMVINYQKRNIGLLEFIDFYDSYKQNTLQINNIKLNRISALEDLNFYTGTNFYN